MKLSIIIPCKNEVGVVEHLLDSLIMQEIKPAEIVVVDSHSNDATASVVKSYSDRLPIVVITAQEKGAAAARNEGAAYAHGDLLLFVDADVRLPRNFIRRLTAQVADKSLRAGGFSQRMISRKWSIRLGAHLMNSYVRLMSITPWPIVFSCFFATKDIHKQINGFDTAIWIMEDYDYVYRARKTGAKFGLIRGTHFNASDRRFQKNAPMDIFKAIYAEMYRYTHGMRITEPLFTYKMGGVSTKSQTPKR
jgi:glycosyltransferase involved in cell wall biosynthesis